MYKIFKDKERIFKCDVDVQGVDNDVIINADPSIENSNKSIKVKVNF